MLDVAFTLRGDSIPADHGWELFRLLDAQLEWLEAEPGAGVHPIRGARPRGGQIHLGTRARLMLRLPQHRAQQAYALSGVRLDLGGGIEVGSARLRPLLAYATVYSQFVAMGAADEISFQREASAALEAAEIECKLVIGSMRRVREQDAEVVGFALMLHGLSPEDSLRIQASGLGTGRKFGRGLFVPHKSAAAVGE